MDELQRLQRENRKLTREISHLKQYAVQERSVYVSMLNQEKARTFLQRERERCLMLLLANSPNIIVFLSKTGRIEFCTDYFVKKAGLESIENILSRSASDIFLPLIERESHREFMALIEEVNNKNVTMSFEARFSFSEEIADFAGLIVPMRGGEKNIGGTMLIFHDITNLKRSREEAMAANLAKSTFLSGMSHEIRTPLNAIIGMTKIGKESESISRKNYALEKIENASAFLLGVVNDILDISKIESGKMELSPIDFNFQRLIDRIVSVVSVRIMAKKQEFHVYIDPDIPNYLFGDDHCLAQVITNVLSNATKFTPENNEISLFAELLHKDDKRCTIKIRIKDTGIGISKEEQAKIFNVFQQAEAGVSRKFGGSGLGLTISKRLLELMDGEITVESEKGKGSEFAIIVSLLISEDNILITQNETLKLSYNFAGKTVLLVDDIELNLEMVEIMLEPTNIEVVKATNGKEAVEMFAENPARFDIILMDLQMPEIDGLQATQMIRELENTITCVPIIAMTANVFREDIEKCLAAGMNGHVGKPIDADELKGVLAQFL